MNSLIIGNTSQLAQYFPEEYERISSRNIDFDYFKDKFYDRIFFCFAEQRTYLQQRDIFLETNVVYTIKLIEFFAKKCKSLVVYGTCELWNNYDGPITLNLPFNYFHSPYVRSKDEMCNAITQLRMDYNTAYQNIIIIHPFNFNSPFRKGGFLFAKIFNSIIHKDAIEIGDTYFYRDLIHPRYVVERSIKANIDEIVGSGRLTFVNDFIRDLYSFFNLSYDVYVTENIDKEASKLRRIFYLDSQNVRYKDLLRDTVYDINKVKGKAG